MQTRKDQVQAYQFAMGRLAAALVSGDPGNGDSPTKRTSIGTYFGALVVVLLCIGFGVFGLISPVAKTSWKVPGAVVVQKENGNRYLYDGKELRPVRNFASALLISPAGASAPQSVSARSLAGVPIGSAVGIPDAPDAVPAQSALLTGAWTRCLRPGAPGGQVIDFSPAGRTSALPGDRQVLVSGPGDTRYVLWNGTKFKVGGEAVLIALGMADEQVVPAPKDWLSAVPDGPELAAPDIPGAGRPAGEVAGETAGVGDLFETNGGGTPHFFVMLEDGVTPVSPTVAALMSTRDGAGEPRKVSASGVAAASVSKKGRVARTMPDLLNMRPLAPKDAVVCLRQESAGKALRTRVVVERGAAATGSRKVLIPPGGGVLAVDQAQLNRRGAPPQEFLITEDGVAFPLAGDQAASALGYGNGDLLALPRDVMAMLPKGPALSRTVAAATVRAR